ncbi:hypothetical protein RFI_05545, partial [Reticulomyxa filosa]
DSDKVHDIIKNIFPDTDPSIMSAPINCEDVQMADNKDIPMSFKDEDNDTSNTECGEPASKKRKIDDITNIIHNEQDLSKIAFIVPDEESKVEPKTETNNNSSDWDFRIDLNDWNY